MKAIHEVYIKAGCLSSFSISCVFALSFKGTAAMFKMRYLLPPLKFCLLAAPNKQVVLVFLKLILLFVLRSVTF